MDQTSVNTPTNISVRNTNTAPLDNSISTETLSKRINVEILINNINPDTSKDQE